MTVTVPGPRMTPHALAGAHAQLADLRARTRFLSSTPAPILTSSPPIRNPQAHETAILDALTDDEVDTICGLPTLDEALAEVFRRLCGLPLRITTRDAKHLATVELPDERYAQTTFTDYDRNFWVTTAQTPDPYDEKTPKDASVLRQRRVQLERRLCQFTASRATLMATMTLAGSDWVIGPMDDVAVTLDLHRRAALCIWWEARLREGFTPDTAWALLGLGVPIMTLRVLACDGSDCPTFTNGPST